MNDERPSSVDGAVGGAIREARFSRGMTQEDLAMRVGTTRATLASYETGRRKVPIEVLLQIARACDKPLTFFDPTTRDTELQTPTPTPEQATLQAIMRALEARPDAIPFVMELLEAFIQEREATDRHVPQA